MQDVKPQDSGSISPSVCDRDEFSPIFMLSPPYDSTYFDWSNHEAVAMLHLCLDETGKFQPNERIVSFAGWISDANRWQAFQEDWKRFLKEENIPALHTSELMSHSLSYRGRTFSDRQEKLKLLGRAACLIQPHVLAGIGCAVDCDEFRRSPVQVQEFCHGNAQLMAFHESIKLLINSLKELETKECLGRTHPVGIIIDESEEYNVRCVQMYTQVKKKNCEWRIRLGSLCVADDELYVPLQSADLIAWLTGQLLRDRMLQEYQEIVDKCRKDRLFFSAGYDKQSFSDIWEKIRPVG